MWLYAAFPLHQKTLGIYLNEVNGATIQLAEKELTEKIGKDGVLELVEKMKADGYLSSEYQYELKNKPKVRISKELRLFFSLQVKNSKE